MIFPVDRTESGEYYNYSCAADLGNGSASEIRPRFVATVRKNL